MNDFIDRASLSSNPQPLPVFAKSYRAQCLAASPSDHNGNHNDELHDLPVVHRRYGPIDLDGALPSLTESDDEVNSIFESNQRAIGASEHEQNMTFRYALKHYRPAVVWATLAASLIMLEGYETALMPNFFSYGPFQHLYGALLRYTPEGSPVLGIIPIWQSGILAGGASSQLIGLFLAPRLANRFGFRITAMFGLG